MSELPPHLKGMTQEEAVGPVVPAPVPADTYVGVKPVGQGSWGGYGTNIPPGTKSGFIPWVPGPGSDPFAEGRLIDSGSGVEIDWDLLKQVLWEDRFLLSASALMALLTYLVVKDPVKYAQVLQAITVGIAETTKGIGEVIPL